MSNYYETQTTMDNALRTICHLCEENSKLRADLEGWKRVHEDAMHLMGTRDEEIAGLKQQISDLKDELDALSKDHEGYSTGLVNDEGEFGDCYDDDDEDEDYEDEDYEDECPSVSARNPHLNGSVGAIMVDPPSGWKYGFPKILKEVGFILDTHPNRGMNSWLFVNGYPLEEIAIWVPKDKQKAKMSFDYVLKNAEVPYRTQRFPSEDGS
jgi:hypothetical protein